MPAWKPTADSIWNSFRSSGKRHLLLTGSRGSGKSTLLRALTGDGLPGITTFAVPGEAVYLRENGTDRQVRIGIFDICLPGTKNRMQPVIFGFAALGIPALKRCRESDSAFVSIDEIGYLEQSCPEYCAELEALMVQKQLIAAVRKQEVPFLQSLLRREDCFTVDLDDPFGSVGCVVMASGLGKRFGGNKLMAPFGEEPMIARILDATEGLFSRRVVVTRSEEAAALCRSRGIETVLHSEPYRSDTVRLGLEALGDVDRCLFCPADQPLLRRQTIASLLLCGRNAPDAIWRPQADGTPGAPILFPNWIFPELLSLPQGKGGGYAAKNHPEAIRYLEVSDPAELCDVDTPEDLLRLHNCIH